MIGLRLAAADRPSREWRMIGFFLVVVFFFPFLDELGFFTIVAPWHIRRFWRAVRKGAGIPHVRFHDLRHTAASEMLRRGLLLREVQYVLGHSSPRMTERYAHFARTFKPPKSLSWSVQQSVMHEPARQAAPTH